MGTWHPVNDNLMGTAEYGDPQDDTQPWSLPWSVLEVEEFLFATGDKDIWIGGKRQGDSFSWLDGTSWDYQNWSPNNPSHQHEECAEIFALNYYPSNWNDDSCSSRNAFVCQLTPANGRSSDWTEFEGTCYKYFSGERTWEDSETHCRTVQANLASVHSARENTFLGDLSSGETWIGGKRVCLTCDEWTWTDGTPWDFVNWRIRGAEPDNKQGKENIMGIDGGDPNNGWFDDGADVDETKPFICSKRMG